MAAGECGTGGQVGADGGTKYEAYWPLLCCSTESRASSAAVLYALPLLLRLTGAGCVGVCVLCRT